jgi:hypothetical protein
MADEPKTKPATAPRQRLPLNAAIPRQAPLPADLVELVAKEREQGAGAASGGNPRSISKPALTLQIRGWDLDKATKLVIAITALASLIIGIRNSSQKEEVETVRKVETKVQDIALRVDGKSDQKGASSEGESIAEQTKKSREQIGQLIDVDCKRAQWLKQVFAQAKPPIVVYVEGCPPAAPIDVTEELPLPGRRGKGAIVVRTPFPRAQN